MQAFRVVFLLGLAILEFGCSGKQDEHRPNVHPVSGKILVAGKAAAGAQAVLFEKGQTGMKAFRPHGTAGADGIFHLTTFTTDDGAPDGDYALTVTWPSPPVKGQAEDEFGPDRLKNRYSDARRPAAQVTITAETRELPPVDLK
jgi:hypothetical protein